MSLIQAKTTWFKVAIMVIDSEHLEAHWSLRLDSVLDDTQNKINNI